jgi:hypothetical protein
MRRPPTQRLQGRARAAWGSLIESRPDEGEPPGQAESPGQEAAVVRTSRRNWRAHEPGLDARREHDLDARLRRRSARVTEQPPRPDDPDQAAEEAATEAWAPPAEGEAKPHGDELSEATAPAPAAETPTEVHAVPTEISPAVPAPERPAPVAEEAAPAAASAPEPEPPAPAPEAPAPEPVRPPPPPPPPAPPPPPPAIADGGAGTAAAAERPEIPVAAAFAAGFVLAMILRRLAR